MRIFYYRCMKNFTMIYVVCLLVFTYRMTYNAFYCDIHDEVEASMFSATKVYPSGEIVGIYTRANGIFVIDTSDIETKDGTFTNPSGNALRSGDYILAIDGNTLEEKEEMISLIKESNGKNLEFTISRNGEIKKEILTPVLSKKDEYMLGIWIKDDLAGVGTITYVAQDASFAALGHGMGNGQNKDLLEITDGEVYVSKIIGIRKGEEGEPGEVRGVIQYGEKNHIGTVAENTKEGIFGEFDKDDLNRYEGEELYQIGAKQTIESGSAQIISEISGERKVYDIEITYVDYLATNSNKGLHIKITDEELLELTGGIVQGMSGSPIIQNGKLIGAITHVLINDPTCGYGIFIEEMLH